ncbi:peptidyl-prolyl cis-trans isomerase D [Pustulibacterium marinum]|uniref:Periplasmic chaperone PpiD n=1 Tax=Pustulibacterium marinum TaxID=1224947 RepID=A0A1I7EV11_9FLAO|nr:peptidylprolyl isomerase [Pustulibacterium marinum]SFU27733.1 peptidyl-prolyl cis-trans isomerase D [Pustulibacterium marinum]
MAVLEKIRKRSLLLIALIGFALFAFIISDLVGKGSFTVFQNRNIGEVNGDPISNTDFREKVELTMKGMGANASTMSAVNSVWNREVNNRILEQEFEKLGINVSGERIINLVKNNPQVTSSPMFQNENGVFDAQKFIDYIADLKASSPQAYEQWKMQEESIITNAKQETYYSLIKAGLGVTEKEGEATYAEEGNEVTFKYLQVPYTSIADSTIAVSDSEIKSYINEHKDEFENGANRNARFVIFKEEASDNDVKSTEEDLAKLLNDTKVFENGKEVTVAGFRDTQDVAAFVSENSDISYDTTYVVKSKLPAKFADTLYNLSVGEIYGPYKDGDYFKISRMVGKKPNGSVKASHILISYEGIERVQAKESRTKEEAKALADEILAKAKKSGADFGELAKEYSEDPGSASKGGTYDNIVPGQMVPEFNDFIFDEPIGSIGVVETDFGYHVIKVEDKYETVNVATVARKIDASEETIGELYNNSNQFVYQVTEEGKDFEEAAKAGDFRVRVAANVEELGGGLPGINNQRGIVRWLFEDATSVGDVKKFNIPSGYVVVQLTGINKEGTQSVEAARATVEPILRQEKKAKQILEKGKGKSWDELADLFNVRSRMASKVTLANPTISGAGSEPAVVGTAFGLEAGKTSGLIEGEKGVYMIEVNAKNEAPKLENYTVYRNTLKDQNVTKYSTSVVNALKESADIEDNRATFY